MLKPLATMGFNMFLSDDLVDACTQRFKRSKIDGATYRHVRSSFRLPLQLTRSRRPNPSPWGEKLALACGGCARTPSRGTQISPAPRTDLAFAPGRSGRA